MSHRLTRYQATLLGLVVLLALALGAAGLAALAAKDRLWSDAYEIVLVVPDAGDLPPGTPVRVRGVDAGQVRSVDDHGDDVRLTLTLDRRYKGRIFNDATAKLQLIGLLGSKAIAITPGKPAAGEHATHILTLTLSPGIDAVVAKLDAVADDAGALLKDVRTGTGTLAKLVNDDALYTKATAAVGKLEAETKNVSGLVADGRDTLRSVRQNTDAISRMPIVRSYVENAAALMVRPECRKTQYDYAPADLFEPGTAILHERGKEHLRTLAETLKSDTTKLEIVVASIADESVASAAAMELTRKQAEVVAALLKEAGAHKTSFWHKNRPVTPIGLGAGPSPLEPDAKSKVQILAFQMT